MSAELAGRTVIVTGAGRGIGRGTAKEFAAVGAHVVVSDVVEHGSGSVQSTVDEITAAGGSAIGVVADVSREDDVAKIVSDAMNAYGQIDVLVNNAGIFEAYLPSWEFDIERFDRTVGVDLRGPYLCSRAVVPHMQDKGGSIVNVTSAMAEPDCPQSTDVGYAVSKAGLNRLTMYMAVELRKFDIAVNAVVPQGILSEGLRPMLSELFDAPDFSQFQPTNALAPAIMFLARQRASFTGQVVWRDEFDTGDYKPKQRIGEAGALPPMIQQLHERFAT